MARTPLFHRLQQLLRRARGRRARAPGAAPPPEGPSRRRFLETLAALAAVPVVGPALAGATGCSDDDDDGGPAVAIVGGGIAGLTTAHFLELAGVKAVVYEASMRVGGRMFTERMGLQGGQLAERGGELVDSDHVVIPMLCDTFGLVLDDLVEATPGLAQDQFHFHGAFLTEAQLVSGFAPIAAKMQMTITASDSDETEFARIDALSIPQYLEQECGLAAGSLMRDLLETAYLEEYGLEVPQQSAWNLLFLIDAETPDPFRIFGDSDERFHIHSGSESLPAAMGERLAAQIELDHKLAAVTATGDRFEVSFATTGGPVRVLADHVVYALPFTKLREVDLDASALSEDKRAIIDTIGYGTNAKLMMQFSERHWETAHGSSGSVITDIGDLQTMWATSRGQPGPQGLLTNFVGARAASPSATVRPSRRPPWCCPGSTPRSPAPPRRTSRAPRSGSTGRRTSSRRAATPATSWASGRSPAPKVIAKATSTSAASTPPSIFRATWKAAPARGRASRSRSCATSRSSCRPR